MFLMIAELSASLKASLKSSPFISRRALDPEVTVGSIWDATTGKVIDRIRHQVPMQSISTNSPPICSLTQNLPDSIPNLLKNSDTGNDLSLFVDLHMVPPEGQGRLIHCSHVIDQYTRMICYTWISHTNHLPDYYFEYTDKIAVQQTYGTHLIVLVNYGIDATILLQLPCDDQLVQQIDSILQDQCEHVNEDRPSILVEHEETLKKIRQTKVLSNIPELRQIQSIFEFFQKIDEIKNDRSRHKPYNINLYPINLLFSVAKNVEIPYKELSSKHQTDLEEYLFRIIRQFNILKMLIKQQYSLSRKWIPIFQQSLSNERTKLRQLYDQEISRLQQWLTRFRSGASDENSSYESIDLTAKLNELQTRLVAKNEKEKFLNDLEYHKFEYRQAIANEEMGDTNDRNVRIIFGSDHLHRKNPDEWNRIKTQLINEREQKSELRLIYVDFTDHQDALDQFRLTMKLSASNEQVLDNEEDIINVVLIGDSGAGKSTFINALVNYLNFDTYQQAETHKPIVLLPISFLLTSGYDFQVHEITYDGIDTDNKELHGESGRSVTQSCRSYLFTIKDDEGQLRKLRLIDTPGSGDTLGSRQDELNRQDIFFFLESLPRLHAICLVMKPNLDQLTSSFTILLKELINYFGVEIIKDLLLFCYTNTRATFFVPGSTNKALRQFFQSLSIPIVFNNNNIFCFDSESFRYLVAKQRGVTFDDDEADCSKETWDRSSVESKRFLNILLTKSTVDDVSRQQQSAALARLKIYYLIRPMTETIRNIIRHIILNEAKQSRIHIKLQARSSIDNVYHRCYCDPREYGKFYMLVDSDDTTHDQCLRNSISSDHRPVLHYSLNYIQKQSILHEPREILMINVNNLCEQMAIFSRFLSTDIYSSSTDPILLALNQMIHEEQFICQSQSSAILNVLLLEQLSLLKNNYIELVEKSNKSPDLSTIYSLMDEVEKDVSIKDQLNAIQNSKRYFARQRQYQVPFFSVKN